jgi:hypothetical protein
MATCIEQSRSPSKPFLNWSAMIWISMPRVGSAGISPCRPRVAEERRNIGLGGLVGVDQCSFRVHHPHTASTTTGSLDDDRIALLGRHA